MKNEIKILYVEDDLNLSFVTKDNLTLKGYNVDLFDNGADAWQNFQSNKYDLCIVDVMLPKLDGFSLAKKIRTINLDTPILFLTAKSDIDDKIEGLKSGGDDYITKPFSIEELNLKIQIFLKRNKITDFENIKKNNIGIFELDNTNLILKSDKKEIKLTYLEAELLQLFIDNENQIIKRDTILFKIWGDNDYFKGRSLDVFISRLRKFLSSDASLKIENIHGIGFRLVNI